jgi:hypothetical protein
MERKRTRAKLFHRLNEGIKQIYLKPLKIIAPLLLVITFLRVWQNMRSVLSGISWRFILVQTFITYVAMTVVILLFVTMFVSLIILIGKPRKSQYIDSYAEFSLIDSERDYYRRPFLISRTPIKGSSAERLVFWSYWLSKKKWMEREDELCDMMNVHLIENIDYGGKNGNDRRIIVLIVGEGALPPHRGEIEDEEL